MLLAGLTKLTLIDYPGKLACIAFTQGCQFRCPFCHNPNLIKITKKNANQALEQEKLDEFFNFLKKRKDKLEGVVITGGEPTAHNDLPEFIVKIKRLGYSIKLDSNGSNPQMLQQILDSKLVDYIAMDIKHTKKKYFLATGVKVDLHKIQKSIDLIKNSGLNYEFRTTVVPGIHSENDFQEIAKWIGFSQNYFLQKFRPQITLDQNIGQIAAKNSAIDLWKVAENIKNEFEFVGVRE